MIFYNYATIIERVNHQVFDILTISSRIYETFSYTHWTFLRAIRDIAAR